MLAGLALALVLAAAGVALYVLPGLPDVDQIRAVQYHVPLRVYASDGSLLAEFGEKRRIPLTLDQIPLRLRQAVIAAEDDRFYEHPGVDYQGLLRAALHLAQSHVASQGGSTITMQVARNFFLDRERTFWRKLREIFLALEIEKTLGKDEILTLYLNQNYMGNRAYGVGAAAQTYYGKDLDQLSLPQLAMLAGLYKAPSRFNPLANPQRARLRRNYVLRRMAELGFIDEAERQAAQQAPLTAALHTPRPALEAAYAAEMVRARLYREYGESIYSSGLQVTTTIVPRNQRAAVAALRKHLIDYDRRHGYRGPEGHVDDPAALSDARRDALLADYPTYGGLRAGLVLSAGPDSATVYLRGGQTVTLDLAAVRWARPYIDQDHRGKRPQRVDQVVKAGDVIRLQAEPDAAEGAPRWRLAQLPAVGGALVSLAPEDGAITALVGGFDYFLSRFNRATQALRQPGSSFKPFVYAAALNKGLTPATVFNDAPVVHENLIGGTRKLWRPENYSGRFYGPTRLRVALAKSRNLVSIRLLARVGLDYTLRQLRKFGFAERALPADLSLALGTGSITPLELATAYATFANGGYRVEPYLIREIRNRDGKVIYRHVPLVACQAPCDELVTPELLAIRPEAAEDPGKRLGKPAPRVLDPQVNYQMVSMMRDVIRMGTATRARVLKRSDLAGKTGTTNEQRDAWFSGFNHDIVSVVWIGFDKLRPLGRKETGGHLALPVWIDYMRVALEDSPERPWLKPPGMVTVKIDADTGLRATAGTVHTAFETFRPGHVPPEGVATLAPGAGVEVPEQIF